MLNQFFLRSNPSESDKENLRWKSQNEWEWTVLPFLKWKLEPISAFLERLNLLKFWVRESRLQMKKDFKIGLGLKYWTIMPPTGSHEKFVRPWLVRFHQMHMGFDLFQDDDGNSFLMATEKDPATFLFTSADEAMKEYYSRKIEDNESKVLELLNENKIMYTMMHSIL